MPGQAYQIGIGRIGLHIGGIGVVVEKLIQPELHHETAQAFGRSTSCAETTSREVLKTRAALLRQHMDHTDRDEVLRASMGKVKPQRSAVGRQSFNVEHKPVGRSQPDHRAEREI